MLPTVDGHLGQLNVDHGGSLALRSLAPRRGHCLGGIGCEAHVGVGGVWLWVKGLGFKGLGI